MRSQVTRRGRMIPTEGFAPKTSAMIRTFTIARPGKPVLEKPRQYAPASARA